MFNKIYEIVKEFIKNNYKFLIVFVVLLLLVVIELPYVIYTPGGNINLNDRVDIDGEYELGGTYNMAFVTVYRGNIPFILLSYLIPNWDLKSVDDVTLDNQSLDERFEIDKVYMEASVDASTILAYEKADKNLTNINENLTVLYVDEQSKTDLEVLDTIISVDAEYKTFDEISSYLKTKNVGDIVTIKVNREGTEIDTTSEIIEIEGNPLIGILFLSTYDYDSDPEIKIKINSDESGPSGGLMLALSIYDQLISEDLTNDKKIVGTGTINIDGSVGEIDGVKYKMLGSKDADIFICPEENYEEAIQVKEDNDLNMEVIKVSTFDEAVEKLKNIN